MAGRNDRNDRDEDTNDNDRDERGRFRSNERDQQQDDEVEIFDVDLDADEDEEGERPARRARKAPATTQDDDFVDPDSDEDEDDRLTAMRDEIRSEFTADLTQITHATVQSNINQLKQTRQTREGELSQAQADLAHAQRVRNQALADIEAGTNIAQNIALRERANDALAATQATVNRLSQSINEIDTSVQKAEHALTQPVQPRRSTTAQPSNAASKFVKRNKDWADPSKNKERYSELVQMSADIHNGRVRGVKPIANNTEEHFQMLEQLADERWPHLRIKAAALPKRAGGEGARQPERKVARTTATSGNSSGRASTGRRGSADKVPSLSVELAERWGTPEKLKANAKRDGVTVNPLRVLSDNYKASKKNVISYKTDRGL